MGSEMCIRDRFLPAFRIPPLNIEEFRLAVRLTVSSVTGAPFHWLTLTWQKAGKDHWLCNYVIKMPSYPRDGDLYCKCCDGPCDCKDHWPSLGDDCVLNCCRCEQPSLCESCRVYINQDLVCMWCVDEAEVEGLTLGQRSRLDCLLYTSPSPRDGLLSRMPSSA